MVRQRDRDPVSEVHYIAERFMEDYLAKQAHTLTTESLEREVKRVIIMRDRIPQFYAATKANGTVIWAHDKRFAKYLTVPEAEHTLYELSLAGFAVKVEEQEPCET